MASTVSSVQSSSCASLPSSQASAPANSSVSAVADAALSNASLAPSAAPLSDARVQELFEEGLKLLDAGDFIQAADRMRQAADAGALEARFNLGLMYLNGSGVEKNNNLAVQCIEQAANAGLAGAKFYLGRMYSEGNPVKRDINRGLELFIEAARLGSPKALRSLGLFYLKGKTLEKDLPKALKFLTRAADLGDAEAQFELGLIFLLGGGIVPADRDKAKMYLELAAKQRHAKALKTLTNFVIAESIPLSIELLRRAKLEGADVQPLFNELHFL